MLPELKSLFSTADGGRGEIVSPLLEGDRFRVEQIDSFGAASEPGFWYDQEQPEWVVLVRGTATLEFEEGSLELEGGDYLLIPERRRHRVARTSEDSVWLAIHFHGTDPGDGG